jgi:glycosyltransferase involved in cell wall biosynthesis
LWHDWWVTSDTDVVNATVIFPPTEVDVIEAADLSGAHARLFHEIPRVKQMTLTVDVSWLGPHETGAQVLTTSALSALVHQDAIAAIRLVGVSELPEYAHHLVDEPKVEVLSSMDEAPVSDLIWYPNQVDGRGTMASARRLGRRVVVTYLDLIAYDIRRYHATPQAWQLYRALQRRIALSVDGVTTISTDVATRLMEEVPRLDPARVQPIILGLDHVTAQEVPASPPEQLRELTKALGSKRFILVLGNDFGHKNRDFAIRVWQQVLQAGQQCDLVLAGLHVRGSSSKDAEDVLTALHVDLRGRVHTVGHVDSASRMWLLSQAAVVLYPTSAEGFGLVPYEAAALGTPSTFTDFGPLREVSEVKGLPKGWSLDAYAADVVSMLTDANAAEARIGTLMQAISRHSWDAFATQLADFFTRIAAMPVSPAGLIGGDSAADAAALSSILSSRSYRLATRMQGVAGRLRRK